MTTPNQIRERLIAAVARGDTAAVSACYHPDAVMVAPEGRFHGREQIELYYRTQFDAFTDIQLRPSAVFDTRDTAVSEWTFHATHTGALEMPDGSSIPATGLAVTQRGADMAAMDDGKIREHRLYYDQVELLEQIRPTPALEAKPHV